MLLLVLWPICVSSDSTTEKNFPTRHKHGSTALNAPAGWAAQGRRPWLDWTVVTCDESRTTLAPDLTSQVSKNWCETNICLKGNRWFNLEGVKTLVLQGQKWWVRGQDTDGSGWSGPLGCTVSAELKDSTITGPHIGPHLTFSHSEDLTGQRSSG